MNQNRTVGILIGVVLFMGLLVLLLGGLAAYLIYRTPLNVPMSVVTQEATVAKPIEQQATATPAPTATTETRSVEIQPEKKPVETCGNTGTLTVLFTGVDSSTGDWPLGADSVRVVKFDFDQKKMVVVAFPRDLWVTTSGLADQGIPASKLGLAYHYKWQNTLGSDKHRTTTATTLIGQSLYDTFGLAPQSYFTMQLDNVAEMINTVGGVEIDNPTAFTSEYGVYFPAGTQTMDGARAKEYVRAFVEGDDVRLQRQDLFIQGLQDRVVSTDILTSVPDLIKQFDKSINTDLSPKQLADLACMAKEVPQDQIEFYQVYGNLVTLRSDGALVPNIELVTTKLKEWLGE